MFALYEALHYLLLDCNDLSEDEQANSLLEHPSYG